MPRRLLVLVALLMLAACCGAPPPGTALPSPPTEALAAWQSFPADQIPRPIILFFDLHPSGNGYAGGDEKIAAMCSKFALATTLPAQVPSQAVATWNNGTTVTYPAISAADAFVAMARAAGVQSPDCATVAPLPITGTRFGTTQVKTDRGTATMSAWLFSATGANGDLAWPALARSAFWDDGTTRRAWDQSATASSDARVMTFTFTGAPDNPGPCGADYAAAVAESTSAVAIRVLAISHSAPGAPIACTAIAAVRTVTVVLGGPLGGRVLVNAEGDAVAVCAEAARPGC